MNSNVICKGNDKFRNKVNSKPDRPRARRAQALRARIARVATGARRLALAVVLVCIAAANNMTWAKDVAFAGVVNLNTATAQELERLPGVGPSKAAKIIEHRQRRPFRTVAELVRVKGFGSKTLQKLRPFLTVTEATQLERPPQNASCACPPQAAAQTAEPEAPLRNPVPAHE